MQKEDSQRSAGADTCNTDAARRYAVSGESNISKTYDYDVVIVGAGLAGLYTALNIDGKYNCIILAKENIDISSSWLAQGGIAAAIDHTDSPRLHLDDTVTAGAGLCDIDAAQVLVNEGPRDIETLVRLNVPFDLDEYGELQLTREGGHNQNRIVHAGGDATGRETIKALSHIVSNRGNITFCGHTCLFDVLTGPDGVCGVVVSQRDSEFHLIRTRNVVIATGGIGQVYQSSTNPSIATGDGLASAIRAGARLKNIEFVQFHPTGLWTEESAGCAFLISEAVRGEGGLLVNSAGERFMAGEHELAELAPRDIVARGILRELSRSGESHVFIDITAKSEEFLKRRFPTIYGECLSHGIDMARDRIPVRPVQHYIMGGIRTDIDGRSNIAGLYACGEAANTGVHGANRLASNSMLECLVFGRRAAQSINASLAAGATQCGAPQNTLPQDDAPQNALQQDDARQSALPQDDATQYALQQDRAPRDTLLLTDAHQNGCGRLDIPFRPRSALDYTTLRGTIKQLMSEHCNVVRRMSGMAKALKAVTAILQQLESVYDERNEYLETRSIATVAAAILEAAQRRPKSIGSHYVQAE